MKKRHEMPEFEKWLDKKSYSQAEERIAEVVWGAALGCVRKEIKSHTPEAGQKGLPFRLIIKYVLCMIGDELGEIEK